MKKFTVRFEVVHGCAGSVMAKVHCVLLELGFGDGVVIGYQMREELVVRGAKSLPSKVEVVFTSVAGNAQKARVRVESVACRFKEEFGLDKTPSIGFETDES